MRVVAFLGSPRRGGNTELLLRAAMEGAGGGAEGGVELFDLCAMKIGPCLNCGGCDATGLCIVQDDMGLIYDALRGADRVMLATPIYFMGPSAQTKAMIDRCQAFWCEKYLLKRPLPEGPMGRKGLLLLVGGMNRPDGVRCCQATATAFFRTISVPGHSTLSFVGVDAMGAIERHPTALREAGEAGAALVKGG